MQKCIASDEVSAFIIPFIEVFKHTLGVTLNIHIFT